MNLKQIESFVAVADTRGFSQAAGLLYLTQPTVSAHISTLEKELNVRLFARTTKEVVLTDKGEQFYEMAAQMLKLEKKMVTMFAAPQRGGANVLHIAASTIPAQYLLPDILKKFSLEYPKVRFTIKEIDSECVINEIKEQTVDVGFTGTQFDEKECRYINLCKDEILMITPNDKKYSRLVKSEENLDWILNEPVVMREEGSGTRREAERMLLRQGIDASNLNIIATFESTETIKKSVANGMGISFISKLAVEEEIKNKILLSAPIDKTEKGRNLNMVYNNHVIQSKNAEAFMQVVKKYFKQ